MFMGDTGGTFFVTEALKKAKEEKPITSYIPEEGGRDPNPAYDEVARALWPATKEKQTDREALAEVLMWSIYDDTVLSAARDSGVVMARLCQKLVGDGWMEHWILVHQNSLRSRVSLNKRRYGGLKKAFKDFVASL